MDRRRFIQQAGWSSLGLVVGEGWIERAEALPSFVAGREGELLNRVRSVCQRLGRHGWSDLLRAHGLDINASDLERELRRRLDIRRDIPGFEDFAPLATRAIEPGRPAQSLLFHALASPRVVRGADGRPLSDFPTLDEIEAVENYVYGVTPPSLADLLSSLPQGQVAIAVYAVEYRSREGTPHKAYADQCYSRTGISRVGNAPPRYEPMARTFTTFAQGDDRYSIRVMPARFAAYIAVKRQGNGDFGIMRKRPAGAWEGDDNTHSFWIPIHKLFNGPECIRGLNLQVSLHGHHINDKLRRLYTQFPYRGPEIELPDLDRAPFVLTEGLAELIPSAAGGSGLIVPVVHPRLVEPAQYNGRALSFPLPPDHTLQSRGTFGRPSLCWDNAFCAVEDLQGPTFIHARHRLSDSGEVEDIADSCKENVGEAVARGGYRVVSFTDFTGDGWVEAECPALRADIPIPLSAYSILSPPDFFPLCGERQLSDWWERTIRPEYQKATHFFYLPEPLSDRRYPLNLQLGGAKFSRGDNTGTAIISAAAATAAAGILPEPPRTSFLPDHAGGTFNPGWDVGLGATDDYLHLASYRLSSPFTEDAKICAAMGSYWPGTSPDASATFDLTPTNFWTTVPLTDEENGISGDLPWDGYHGPRLVTAGDQLMLEYTPIDCADYLASAVQGRFSIALTSRIHLQEYGRRVLSIMRAYEAARARFLLEGGGVSFGGYWKVASFRHTDLSDAALDAAPPEMRGLLSDSDYLFALTLCRIPKSAPEMVSPSLARVRVERSALVFVDPNRTLVRKDDGTWEIDDSAPSWLA
jgi:hypothetical protein